MLQTNKIKKDSIVDLIFHLKWKSGFAAHTDALQASKVNIWRDFLPPVLLDKLMDKETGERLQMSLEKGDSVAAFETNNLLKLKNSHFDRQYWPNATVEPRLGRFYPMGVLKGVNGVFKANIQPFRCVGLNNGHLTVDLNHPLAGRKLTVSAVVGKVKNKNVERGGTSVAWMENLLTGPGMQARWQDQQTDYFSKNSFRREDEQLDSEFYRDPRLVSHIDETAREMVRNTYGRFLSDGMQVLDLMSSWQSHLPAKLNLKRVVGLGLNREELKKNPRLTERVVKDLNHDGGLPFEDNSFDAVINTVSVEYLTDPVSIFREISRILRPHGYFVVTFSNRWFPTKTIKIWPELHEFERLGLVLEYFLRTGAFQDLQTYSIRGLPRPHDDKYFPELLFSDPIYAVWGRKV